MEEAGLGRTGPESPSVEGADGQASSPPSARTLHLWGCCPVPPPLVPVLNKKDLGLRGTSGDRPLAYRQGVASEASLTFLASLCCLRSWLWTSLAKQARVVWPRDVQATRGRGPPRGPVDEETCLPPKASNQEVHGQEDPWMGRDWGLGSQAFPALRMTHRAVRMTTVVKAGLPTASLLGSAKAVPP